MVSLVCSTEEKACLTVWGAGWDVGGGPGKIPGIWWSQAGHHPLIHRATSLQGNLHKCQRAEYSDQSNFRKTLAKLSQIHGVNSILFFSSGINPSKYVSKLKWWPTLSGMVRGSSLTAQGLKASPLWEMALFTRPLLWGERVCVGIH